MIFRSTEVRWFFQGEIPPKVESWFSGLDSEKGSETPRVDIYLLNTGDGNFGIKLRQNMLEVKEREIIHGNHIFNPSMEGVIESWNKTSFLLAPQQHDFYAAEYLTDSWISVKKTRRQAIYQKLPTKTDKPTILFEAVEACHLELTSILVKEQRWWTIALEAYGNVSSDHERLIKTGRQLPSENTQLGFGRNNSMGYPQWLNELAS